MIFNTKVVKMVFSRGRNHVNTVMKGHKHMNIEELLKKF